MRKSYPILAAEGRVHLAIALLLGALSTWLFGWWSLPVWVFVAFVVQFFRDPPRKISKETGAIVSPASGKIVFIGESENPYDQNQQYLKISVFMNVFSVHSNLIPVGGTVKSCQYFPGSFLNAALDKASAENERNAVQIRTDSGEDVFCVQIAGLVARRILCYIKSGDTVETGERYGFIRFGSRVDLYLPTATNLEIKLGDSVASGNDLIGFMPMPTEVKTRAES
ncbi:MAG: phosphatidylserine decarboxylase [Pseudomonadota bacterium]